MKINKKDIYLESKQIQTYIEKNKKLPLTNTYSDGTTLSIYTTSYLMSCLVHDTFKSSSYPTIELVKYNTISHKDTINEKVMRIDYLKMITNFIKYCQENKRVPSYISTVKSKTKVSFELYVYCLSKIIAYYKEKNTLPNYCIFNKEDIQANKTSSQTSKNNTNKSTSTNTYTQKGLLLTTGCSGMGQCTPYYCACNSLQQIFHKLTGKLISEKQIAQWAGTTKNGTDHPSINTAIALFNKKYGTNLKVEWKNLSDLGLKTDTRFQKLAELMSQDNTAIFCHLLYRNKYGHYEVPYQINTKDKTLKICNSLGTKNYDGSYQGYLETRSYTTQQQYISGISQKSICIIRK